MAHPTGTVTFLFTDIEGSTKVARKHREAWEALRARHDAILRAAIETNNGYVFQIIGDAFCAAFHTGGDAIKAAIKSQVDLQAEDWGDTPIRVRMGIHAGPAEIQTIGDYHGYMTLSRVQRLTSAGHGGQVLLSVAVQELVRDELTEGVSLRDLGEQWLKDMLRPERIYQLNIPGLPMDFAPLRTLQAVRHNLPAQMTDFIGREKEMAEIKETIGEHRLVTLTGPGGSGKTRLALQVAGELRDEFRDGVWLVELAPLETAEVILPTIAAALRFSFYEGGDPRQQLLNYLHEKSMLLILDNFEHLLSGVNLVIDILTTAPQVKILSTSRSRLNVQGEQLFHLGGMDFPDLETLGDTREYSAIKMFLQGARRVCPDFELDPESLKYVARICRSVEGMPLGILLASAWAEMLAPKEIAEEIEKSLDFLETTGRDLPDRQLSIRAVFDYSWDRLTPGEQQVFKKLSAFRGGFTREAAQQAPGASLQELMGLVDKSLLHRDSNRRYRIHELLRQYAAEKLAQAPGDEHAAKDLHSAYFAEFLHRQEALLFGKDQRAAISEIEAEIDNIRIGWEWAVEHAQVGWLAEYLDGVGELYETRGWSRAGFNLFASAMQSLSAIQGTVDDRATQLLHGRLLLWQGILGSDFDTDENTSQLLQASIAMFRELGAQREMAYALTYYGALRAWEATEAAEASCQEALSIFRAVGDQRGMALALRRLAWVAFHQGDFPLARQRHQDSLNFFKGLSDQKNIARSLDGLGYICWILGEYQVSKQHHEEVLALCREIGDQSGIASALDSLGIDTYGLRDYQKSLELFLESLASFREIGHTTAIADVLGNLGELALAMGEYDQAAQFAGESIALHAGVIGDSDAWGLRILSNAALGKGHLPKAQTYLRQALQETLRTHNPGLSLLTLVGVAGLLVKRGREEQALELLALVMNHRASWQKAKDDAAPLMARLETELPANDVLAVKQRGHALDLDATVAELLAELQPAA